MVGKSGTACMRLPVLTANIRQRPALLWLMAPTGSIMP